MGTATDGDLSLTAWREGPSLYAATSDGRGLEWTQPVLVDYHQTDGWLSPKSIAVSDGVAYVAWRTDRNGSDEDVYFSRSNDRGSTWSNPIRIPDSGLPGEVDVLNLQLVASGPHVYAAFLVESPQSFRDVEIWLSASPDEGRTWYPSIRANTVDEKCSNLDVVCEGPNAFVSWTDDRGGLVNNTDVFLRMTHNGGQSWMAGMADEQINESAPGVGWTGDVSLAGGMTGLVAAWREGDLPAAGDPARVHVRYSPDGGHMWPLPESTLPSQGGEAVRVACAFDGATIVVAWSESTATTANAYAATSVDFGLTWTVHQVSDTGRSGLVEVAGRDDSWAVINQDSATQVLQASFSRDRGKTWQGPIDLRDSVAGVAINPTLSFNSRYQNFIASWTDTELGFAQVHAGGLRIQTLRAISPSFAPGDAMHFEASHFPASDDGALFAVFVSRGVGNYAVPYGDGRSTGLLSNPYLPAKLHFLSGTLDADGFGATPQITVPNTPGVTWYATALSYLVSSTTGKVYTLTMTDRASLTVQ